MKIHTINKVLGLTAASICTIFAAGQSAQAFSFTGLNSDWHIVQDSFNDGTTGSIVGSLSDYEMFGMAAKVEGDRAYFAFHGNIGTEGKDGITYGDLFLNFSGESFKDASAASQLFAVHFAPNDAGNGDLEYGLYENVSAKSVTKSNSGHKTFASYVNKVENKKKDTTPGVARGSKGTVGFGDLTTGEAQEYLTAFDGGYEDSNHSIQNVMKTGDKVANDGFSFLDESELAGLDFGTNDPAIYPNAQTFGFKLDLGNLPTGDALLSILHECINDGMAMAVNFEAEESGSGILSERVPEPSSIVSLGLIGLALAGIRKKSNQ